MTAKNNNCSENGHIWGTEDCCVFCKTEKPSIAKSRIDNALEMIHSYGEIDGDHHKKWLLDQLVRILADDYKQWVKDFELGEDGDNTYSWNEGIAP